MTNSTGKKVLIIAYYWPPSAGSGVQRWLKFVKYLPQFGWKPYVFTPENPSFSLKDSSLQKDVPAEAEIIRFPIWEPYELFFGLSRIFDSGKKSTRPVELVKKNKSSFFQKISTWIRGNLLIPDPRIFWVRPSVKFLDQYLKENKINIVITTGPPHSMHLIGYKLKKKNPSLKWIADFRDPWSEWGLLDSLMVSNVIRGRHKQLERKVLTNASIVTTITPFYKKHFEKLGGRSVELLTNGFDESDFVSLKIERPDKFVIRHIGIVNEKCDPRPFIQALKTLSGIDLEFRNHLILEFIGDVNSDFKNYIEAIPELKEKVVFTEHIPHKQLVSVYGTSALLLLVLNGYKDAEGYMPGKLFEYIATGLPVLGVGPSSGDAAQLMNETGCGKMFEAEDQQGIIDFLNTCYRFWQERQPSISSLRKSEDFSRRNITGKLSQLLSG
jgi:glycosyltransferase involved in cell wall biosynthesis